MIYIYFPVIHAMPAVLLLAFDPVSNEIGRENISLCRNDFRLFSPL